MAALAIGPELPTMDVGVAVRAPRARVAENQVRVALPAADPGVHPAQRKLGLVVVKFRNVANRLPGGKRMAVLAGQVEVAVRAARAGISLTLLRSTVICPRCLRGQSSRGAQQQADDYVPQQCRAQGVLSELVKSHEIQLPSVVAIVWPPRVAEKRAGPEITKGESRACSHGQPQEAPDSCRGQTIHLPT